MEQKVDRKSSWCRYPLGKVKGSHPLAQCNSKAEYDTDIQEDDAAYGPDKDDLSRLW